MVNYNPQEWTLRYVKSHERECIDVLERLTGGLQECIREGDYKSAANVCNAMCDGFAVMVGIDKNQYTPMLYAYSFILAEMLLFGIGGDLGLRAAIPPLQDALDYAKECSRPGRRTAERAQRDAIKIENMLNDLSRGVLVDTVRQRYCPDFPEDILNGR